MDNINKSKHFLNLITIEDYEDLIDVDKFEIDNNIWVTVKTKYFLNHAGYYEKLEDQDNYKVEYCIDSHSLNPKLQEQIYQFYLLERKNYSGAYEEINNIKMKLLNALNNKVKQKILKKEHSKFSKKLNNIEFFKGYFSIFNNLDIESEKFIKYIKNHFSDNISEVIKGEDESVEDIILNTDYPIYVKWITDGLNINFDEYWIFRELDKIYEYSAVLKFIKEINSLQENKNTVANNVTTNENEYFSRVFISKKTENYLYKILKEYNVLNSDRVVVTGYQGVCDSFWRVAQTSSIISKIFKKNARKSQYLEHLNNQYKANISNTAKGKLSDGGKHDDEIIEYIKLYIKE